ncbi:hypothetical protein [Novosphingobium sp. Gsoil 351]|uniref:hypothetical protein n=1 Tax=Novosphingobium sp. Gsoil 351 TaxID=2675225 RepID=UPI0012B48075|nr:hypothetical protein [Novosphingobium sp. Gsoil 351]QGN53603.1 hypothetical protein GKE62_02635 [Novosphingobium sp. Gsoil 351]
MRCPWAGNFGFLGTGGLLNDPCERNSGKVVRPVLPDPVNAILRGVLKIAFIALYQRIRAGREDLIDRRSALGEQA